MQQQKIQLSDIFQISLVLFPQWKCLLRVAKTGARRVLLLQLLSIHDEVVGIRDLDVMLLWPQTASSSWNVETMLLTHLHCKKLTWITSKLHNNICRQLLCNKLKQDTLWWNIYIVGGNVTMLKNNISGQRMDDFTSCNIHKAWLIGRRTLEQERWWLVSTVGRGLVSTGADKKVMSSAQRRHPCTERAAILMLFFLLLLIHNRKKCFSGANYWDFRCCLIT